MKELDSDVKTILVIGAQGFTGRYLVKELESRNKYNIIETYYKNKPIVDDNTIVKLDLCDRDEVDKLIREVRPQYVVNLAAVSDIRVANAEPLDTINSNVMGSGILLDSIRKIVPETKVLLIGSSEIYGVSNEILDEESCLNPRNIYGLSKYWQEKLGEWYSKEYYLNVIMTRTFNYTGIGQGDNTFIGSMIKQVVRGSTSREKNCRCIQVGNIDLLRDISSVKDIVNAYISLLESEVKSGIYNVCSGKKVLLRDILNKIISFSGKEFEIVNDPKRFRKSDNPVVWGSNQKLVYQTEWRQKYGLEKTLEEMYRYAKGELCK